MYVTILHVPIILYPSDTSQNSAISASVEYISEEVITVKYTAWPDGYVAVLLYDDSSEYSPLRFNGTGTESSVVIRKGTTPCLSLFPLQENDGILHSNLPATVFIRYQHQGHSTVIIVLISVAIILATVHLIIPISIIIYSKLIYYT